MRGELKDDLLLILLGSRALWGGVISTPRLSEWLLEEHPRGRRDHSAQIWMLLMFELVAPQLPGSGDGAGIAAGVCFPTIPMRSGHRDVAERSESSSVIT